METFLRNRFSIGSKTCTWILGHESMLGLDVRERSWIDAIGQSPYQTHPQQTIAACGKDGSQISDLEKSHLDIIENNNKLSDQKCKTFMSVRAHQFCCGNRKVQAHPVKPLTHLAVRLALT